MKEKTKKMLTYVGLIALAATLGVMSYVLNCVMHSSYSWWR